MATTRPQTAEALLKISVSIINRKPVTMHEFMMASIFPAGECVRALADRKPLAKHRNCELVTGDPEFKTMERELKIAWLK